MSGTLYVVATPIGNLGDITHRALAVLSKVEVIAAEDTRITRRLLDHYNIQQRCISYHEKNELQRAEELVQSLNEGNDIAIVSDAGTPCISDPGYRLINLAVMNGINVVSIPGPSAVTAALSISGLPTDHFYFEGFLPKKKGRKTRIKFLNELPATIVIYESPMRVIRSLTDIRENMGERTVSICREITKKFEENFLGSISSAIEYFQLKPSIKGEFVILIAKSGYELTT